MQDRERLARERGAFIREGRLTSHVDLPKVALDDLSRFTRAFRDRFGFSPCGVRWLHGAGD